MPRTGRYLGRSERLIPITILGIWDARFYFSVESFYLADYEPDRQHALFLCLAHPWLIPWFKKYPWYCYIDEWVEAAQLHDLHRIEDIWKHLPYKHDPIPF